MRDINFRYYYDPDKRCPHIYLHGVTEEEVEDVLRYPAEDRRGREGSRIALGKSRDGRYLKVIYVPDPHRDSLFIITAYDLAAKPLAAFRRRLRKRG